MYYFVTSAESKLFSLATKNTVCNLAKGVPALVPMHASPPARSANSFSAYELKNIFQHCVWKELFFHFLRAVMKYNAGGRWVFHSSVTFATHLPPSCVYYFS